MSNATIRGIIEWAKLRAHRLRSNPDDHHGGSRLRQALEALSDEDLREVASIKLLGQVGGSLADAQDVVEFVEREDLVFLVLVVPDLADVMALGLQRANGGQAMRELAEVA